MKKKYIIYYVMILSLFALYLRIHATTMYNKAVESMNKGEYNQAVEYLQDIGDFKDSIELLEIAKLEQKYKEAKELFEDRKFEQAEKIFNELDEFKDSKSYSLDSQYYYAIQLYENGEYEKSAQIFLELKEIDYKDSHMYVAKALLPEMNKMKKELYVDACEKYEMEEYEEALSVFEKLEDYEDSQDYVQKCESQIKRRRLATTLSAGTRYGLGIKKDGTILATSGSQSNVLEWSDIVSISGKGVISIGLMKDGTVVTTGSIPVDTSNWNDIIAISAGDRYIVGLREDGTVVGEGHDLGDGQLNVSDWKNIVDIATGWRHTVGLDSEGELHITGFGSSRQLNQYINEKENWTDIIEIAAGGGGGDLIGHTLGLKADGTVVAIGDNSHRQCDIENWTDIVAIAAGDWHSVGLKKDGTVVAVGTDGKDDFNTYKNACCVDDWTDIVAIAAGSGYTMGLKSDGSVVTVGYDDEHKSTESNKWKNIMIHEEWKN